VAPTRTEPLMMPTSFFQDINETGEECKSTRRRQARDALAPCGGLLQQAILAVVEQLFEHQDVDVCFLAPKDHQHDHLELVE
jgi:hypothetical protein